MHSHALTICSKPVKNPRKDGKVAKTRRVDEGEKCTFAISFSIVRTSPCQIKTTAGTYCNPALLHICLGRRKVQALHVKLKPSAARNDLMRVMQLHRWGGGLCTQSSFLIDAAIACLSNIGFRQPNVLIFHFKGGPTPTLGFNVKSEKSGSACSPPVWPVRLPFLQLLLLLLLLLLLPQLLHLDPLAHDPPPVVAAGCAALRAVTEEEAV